MLNEKYSKREREKHLLQFSEQCVSMNIPLDLLCRLCSWETWNFNNWIWSICSVTWINSLWSDRQWNVFFLKQEKTISFFWVNQYECKWIILINFFHLFNKRSNFWCDLTFMPWPVWWMNFTVCTCTCVTQKLDWNQAHRLIEFK